MAPSGGDYSLFRPAAFALAQRALAAAAMAARAEALILRFEPLAGAAAPFAFLNLAQRALAAAEMAARPAALIRTFRALRFAVAGATGAVPPSRAVNSCRRESIRSWMSGPTSTTSTKTQWEYLSGLGCSRH